MDGWKYEWMDILMYRLIYISINGQTDRWIDGLIDVHIIRWADRQMDGWTDGCTNRLMDEWMDGQNDLWMNRWMLMTKNECWYHKIQLV